MYISIEKAVTKVSKLKRSKRCEATAENKTIPAVGDKAENNAETSANDGSEAAEGSEGVTTLGYYLSQKRGCEGQVHYFLLPGQTFLSRSYVVNHSIVSYSFVL